MHPLQFQQLIDSLNETNTLHYTLNGNPFTDEQFQVFCETLADNTSLKTLNITNHLLSDDAAQQLQRALSKNQTLKELYCCNILPAAHALRHLMQTFHQNKSITRLTCTITQFCHHDAIALAQALETNTTLQNINLLNNPLTTSCDAEFARALAWNTSLLSLDILADCQQTRRQIVLNQRLKTILEKHFFYAITCRNQVIQVLKQKHSDAPSLLGDVLKKMIHINNPTLWEVAAAKMHALISHGEVQLESIASVTPEELYAPLARAHFDGDQIGLPARRLSLFNAPAQALRQEQQNESVNKEDLCHFKICTNDV